MFLYLFKFILPITDFSLNYTYEHVTFEKNIASIIFPLTQVQIIYVNTNIKSHKTPYLLGLVYDEIKRVSFAKNTLSYFLHYAHFCRRE